MVDDAQNIEAWLAKSPIYAATRGGPAAHVIRADTISRIARVNVGSKLAELLNFIDRDGAGRQPLLEPTAVFKGLKRPFLGEAVCLWDDTPEWYRDDEMLVYCLDLAMEFRYENGKIVSRPAREHGCFLVYIRPIHDVVIRRKYQESLQCEAPVAGIICGWEWVDCDDESGERLPENHVERYQERVFP